MKNVFLFEKLVWAYGYRKQNPSLLPLKKKEGARFLLTAWDRLLASRLDRFSPMQSHASIKAPGLSLYLKGDVRGI